MAQPRPTSNHVTTSVGDAQTRRSTSDLRPPVRPSPPWPRRWAKGDRVNSYDYVIVGAGSAGCVLANRLSEDPDVRVLVIEAGGPDTAGEVHVPVAFARLFKTDLDWDFDTEPEPGLDGRRVYLPRG